ncbi:MAG: alpha-2-macroglobulin family protein, partial [Massilia sp.]
VSVRNGIGPGLVRFSVLVLDEKGKPLPNQEVKVDGAEVRRDVKYQLVLPIDETKRFSLCTVKTGADGKGECTVKWSRTGTEQQEWLLRATAPDASAASVTEGRYFFSAGTGGLSVSDADADKVLAGQPLTLTLRSPLVPATALFTIEREGVLASHVRTVSSSEQAIVLPTEPHYAPGVQINVQIVAGAAQASVSPEESPSHSAAYHTSALFDSASHRLKVDLATPHGQVRPGQTVPVSIKVSHGARPAVGARVTLLAFDDALTALQMNLTNLVLEKFWKNRYPTMYSRELLLTWPNTLALGKMPAGWPSSELRVRRIGLYVAPPAPLPAEPETDTILVTGTRRSVGAPMSRVQNAEVRQEVDGMIAGDVGAFPDRNLGEAIRRSIGFAGGPRQADSARTDFSSLALWKTDIVLDRNGEAVVAVPLRDSLTRWRIVAVAMDGTDRYGTGKTFLQTRKNIQILSGLPPSVRSDDTLRQKLTVRNDGERAVTLQLQADARLVADPSLPQGAALSAQARAVRGLALRRSVTLAPHQDKVIDWKLTVPGGLNALDWSIGAVNPKVANGDDNDSLKVMQKVVPAAPVTVRESTVVQLDAPRSIGVAQPPGARPLGGGVAVSWRASLAESAIGSAQAWMAAYPFRCMEQVSSMAVVGAGPAQWQQAMAQLPKFMDANGLVSYFPGTRGSEVLTAYLLDISAAAQLPLPAPEKVKMRAALRKALVGKETVDWLPANGALAHRLALQAALEGDLGDAAQVVPPDLNALPTIALLDWVRHLMTGADTPARRARLDAAAGMLRNRFDLQGTRLTWRGDSGNTAWWMMWTDNVATARTAFLLQQWAALDPRWKDDLPRLMLALVDQQRLGHWDTTVANAWAVASLRRFARDGERGPVGGVSTATYGGATSAQHWPKDEPAILPWPQQGARGTLELRHEGAGAPWATVRVMATMQGDKAVSHGISVKRSVSAVQRKVAGQWSEGDVMKVTLEFTSGAEASWLAVTDPIPSGATILGKGLGGESMLAQRSAAETGSTNWWNRPSYEERGNDSYRAFYQRVTAQTWTTSYTLRLNNAGSFVFPPTRVEAMYAPEIFAETPIAPLQVKP